MVSNTFFNVPPRIRFKFAAHKALAALTLILQKSQGIDLHAIMKTFYFAEKEHLNAYGRPIVGATYRAMKFGPVPLEIYEMVKAEPMWLAELELNEFPWRLEGYKVIWQGTSEADRDELSETDVEAIEAALAKSKRMSFNQRTAATHGPDWQAAELGFMRYEDMIDDGPEKERILENLQEVGRFLRL